MMTPEPSATASVAPSRYALVLLMLLATTAWADQMSLGSGSRLGMNSGATMSLPAGNHAVASGATLSLIATSTAAPTINFTAVGTITVNGAFSVTWSSGSKPVVTGTASGNADLRLLGATVDINGLNYNNGPASGLTVGQSAGPTDCTITNFQQVDFSSAPLNGRLLTVIGKGGFSLEAYGCTFDQSFGAGGANVRVDKVPNPDTTDATVTFIGQPASLGGWGQEALEGGPVETPAPPFVIKDDDADGGPTVDPTQRDGYCTWTFGGTRLTSSPGPDETPDDPTTYTGGQGFITSHYDWYNYAFVANFVLIRTTDGGEDKLWALNRDGSKKYATPYPVNQATYGRVIGPPTTATLGNAAGGPEVVMFTTTNGYIFVVEDTQTPAELQDFSPYPRQPWSGASYPALPAGRDADGAYSLLLFSGGLPDYKANSPSGADTNDRFIFCGAKSGANEIFVTRCFETGKEAQGVYAPVTYAPQGGRPAWSWMAYQNLGGTEYLHVGTDSDSPNDDTGVASVTGHIFRMPLSTGLIDQEYQNPSRPGNHVRGGVQILDDPAFPDDARMYVGCYEDRMSSPPPGTWPSFFSIIADNAGGQVYQTEWTAGLGAGDIDSLALFDDAQIYVGDSAGDFYCMVRVTGAAPAGWPAGGKVSLDPTAPANFQQIRSFPMIPVWGGGPIWVGNDNGKVFVVNRTTGAIEKTYQLGNKRRVRSLSLLEDPADSSLFLVGALTSDGYVFFLRP